VCQLQHLSVPVSVGATECVNSLSVVTELWPTGPVYGCLYSPNYTSVDIVLPAAPLGRQRLVTNHTESRGRTPVTAFINHSFNLCLAASSDEEGGKMRRATVLTDAAAAVDVLLHYCTNSEQATKDDVQPLCAIKRPAVGC